MRYLTLSDKSVVVSHEGEDRVVVGNLDLNKCMNLPNEITGMKPKVPFSHI